MAVAYVPSFLEDRAAFVKDRANGLYGSAAFMLSNFIIGLPYLCLPPFPFSPLILSKLTPSSPHLYNLLLHSLLALQLPAHSRCLLHLDNVAIPRSRRRRIARRAHVVHLPQFRRLSRPNRFCQRALDERRGILGSSNHVERVLEICVPLHRLSILCVPGHDDQ
jgi:hypothetical protein